MDGYNATRAIRQDELSSDKKPRKTIIVGLTANALDGRDKCIECGMDDYLSKPVSRKHILDCIDKWISILSSTTATSTMQS